MAIYGSQFLTTNSSQQMRKWDKYGTHLEKKDGLGVGKGGGGEGV